VSTRASVDFYFSAKESMDPVARIYHHGDGHPEHMVRELNHFFDAVRWDCETDTRFDDPAYLAAKYVVYASQTYGKANDTDPLLKFLSVGIGSFLDTDYTYAIVCSGENERPTIHLGSPSGVILTLPPEPTEETPK